MRKIFSVVAIACLLLCIVVLPASAQASFTTAFAVQNLSDSQTAEITVSFYTEEQGSTTPVFTTPVVYVAPGALGNFLAGTGLPDNWQGSAVVSSSTPIAAIANTFDDVNAPRYWGTYEGFTDSASVSPTVAQPLYVPFALRDRGGRNSTIGIQNAGGTPADVTVQFTGHSSSPVNATVVKNLQPGVGTILQLGSEVAALGSNWMGSVKISSTVPLAASVLDVGTDLVYSFSAIPVPATDLVLPFVAGSRSNQDTAQALLNPNAGPANVTITYSGKIGSTPITPITQSKTLAAGEMWNLSHVTHTGANFLGSAKIHSDQPVLGIVNHTYGSFASPGKKMSYGMLDANKLTGSISLPYVLRLRSSKTQGIIIQNAGDVASTISIAFTPAAGAGNGNAHTVSKLLQPGEFYNFGTDYSEWDPMGNGAYGSMVVTTSPSTKIAAIVNTWNTVVSSSVDSLGSYIGTNF